MDRIHILDRDICCGKVDLTILPCSGKMKVTEKPRNQARIDFYGLPSPHDLRDKFSIGRVSPIFAPKSNVGNIKYFAFAASVLNRSNENYLEQIGRDIGVITNSNVDVRLIECPFLGCGDGGLEPDVAMVAIAKGFISTSHPDSILQLCSDSYLSTKMARRALDELSPTHQHGEIPPEDIAEFAEIASVSVADADEWLSVMRHVPEEHVKRSIASLLKEPPKADWGGEQNDHFSANVTITGRKHTAAFLLKGPTNFKEMTLAMCGKNGDQIYRLYSSGADVSVLQHSHLIGPAARETLRAFVVQSGRSRKFCVMDGQVTYRLLKAYKMLPEGIGKQT